jgi:hypothetical protein
MASDRGKLFASVAGAELTGKMVVTVPRKAPNPHQILPPRRDAVLEIRVVQARLQRPPGSKADAKEITVWIIEAEEKDPPEGEPGLRWVLISTAAIESLGDACERVRWYGKRWLIERLHFTLKSGLRVERLQIDDATSLGHAISLYYVLAYRLLQMAYQAREDPDQPAEQVLSPDNPAVLRYRSGKTIRTAREAIREIARLGGYQYYKNAPPPGVKSLWSGRRYLTAGKTRDVAHRS